MGNAKVYNLAVRKAWREVRQGRRVIVAPATLIMPDSPLCGSQGCLKYPINELTKSFRAWHDIPITLWHPSGGAHSSGSDPDVWERQGIGRLERPTANGKLRAFTVFDEERTRNADRRHGTDVLRRLENLIAGHGEPLELSTGLHTRNVPQAGVLGGRQYQAIATDHGPDHLAVLPGQIGACSVKAGCGIGVVNAKDAKGHGSDKTGGQMASALQKQAEIHDLHAKLQSMSPPDIRSLGELHGMTPGLRPGELHRQLADALHAKGLTIKDTFTGETEPRVRNSAGGKDGCGDGKWGKGKAPVGVLSNANPEGHNQYTVSSLAGDVVPFLRTENAPHAKRLSEELTSRGIAHLHVVKTEKVKVGGEKFEDYGKRDAQIHYLDVSPKVAASMKASKNAELKNNPIGSVAGDSTGGLVKRVEAAFIKGMGKTENANPEGHNQYSAAAAHADSKTDAAESRSEDAHDYAKGKDDLAASALDHAKVLADNDDHVGAAKTLAAAGKQVADAVKEHVAARDAHVEAAGARRDAGKLVKGADADKLDSDKATTRESHRDTAEDHMARAREHHEAAQELKGKFDELKEAHDAVKDEARAVSTQDRASAATVKAHAATDEARAGDSAEKHYVAAQANDKAAAAHRAHAETRSGLGKRHADEMAEGHDKLAASHRAAAKLAKNQARNGGPGSGRRPSGNVKVREAGHIADAASAKAGRTGSQADHMQARITHEDAGKAALAHGDLDIAKIHYQAAAFHASQAEAKRPAGGSSGGHFATLPRPASVAEKRAKGSASLWGYSGTPAATAKPAAAAVKPAGARTAITGRTTNMTNNCRCGGKCKRCKLAALNADDSDIELTTNAENCGGEGGTPGPCAAGGGDTPKHFGVYKVTGFGGPKNKYGRFDKFKSVQVLADSHDEAKMHALKALPDTHKEKLESILQSKTTREGKTAGVFNAAPGQGRHESGRYLPHGAGTGKGAVHQAAVAGAGMGTCNCNMGVYNSAGRCLNCGKPMGTRNDDMGYEMNAGPGKPGPNQTVPQQGGGGNPLGPEDQGYAPGEAEPDQEAQMAQKLKALGISNQADFAALTPAMRALAVNALLENAPAIVTDPDAAGKGVQTGPRRSHDGRDVEPTEEDDPEDFLAADDAGHDWQFPEEPSDLEDAPAEDVAKKGGQVKNWLPDDIADAIAENCGGPGGTRGPCPKGGGKAGGGKGSKPIMLKEVKSSSDKASSKANSATKKANAATAKANKSGDFHDHRAAQAAHSDAMKAHADAKAEAQKAGKGGLAMQHERAANDHASTGGAHHDNVMAGDNDVRPVAEKVKAVKNESGQVKNTWTEAAWEASAAARAAKVGGGSDKSAKLSALAGVKSAVAGDKASHKEAKAAHGDAAKSHFADSVTAKAGGDTKGEAASRTAGFAHMNAAAEHQHEAVKGIFQVPSHSASTMPTKNQRTLYESDFHTEPKQAAPKERYASDFHTEPMKKNQRASGRGHNQRRNSMSKFTKLPPMSRRQMLSALTENCEDPERAAAYMALGNVELAAILTANAARNAKGDDEEDEGDDDSSMEEGSSKMEKNARNAGGNFAGVSDDSSLQAAEDSKIASAGTYGKAGKDSKAGQSTANEAQQVAAWLSHVKAPAAITRAWNAMVQNDQKQRVVMINEIVANSRHAGSKRASRAYAAQLAQLAPEALQAVYEGMPRRATHNGSGLELPAFLNPGSLYVGANPPAWNGAGAGDPLTNNGSIVELEDDDPKALNEERKVHIESVLHKNVSPGLAAAIRNGQVGAPEL